MAPWLERPVRRIYGKSDAQHRRPLHPVATVTRNVEKMDLTWSSGGLGLGACVGSPSATPSYAEVKEKREWNEEDARWLVDSLKRRQSSFGGFGKKVVVRIPRSWRRSRRARMVAWCEEELGFQCVASAEAESTLLEMDRDERRVAALVNDLEKRLAEALPSEVEDSRKVFLAKDVPEDLERKIVATSQSHELAAEPATPEKNSDVAVSRRRSSVASPRSKLRRRRTVAARRVSLTTREIAPRQSETRVVVGGWLTGEARDGRAVVDATRFSDSRHGAVAACVARNRLRVASREEGQRWVEIVDLGPETWPRGRLSTGADGRHYVVLDAATARNEIEIAVIDRMLRFVGKESDELSAVCWGWSRASTRARAWRLSRASRRETSSYRWDKLFSSGTFLAEGAFKRVYRVEKRGAPSSALSVANLDLLGDSATLAAARELEVAFLTTSLAARVPHFVETWSAGWNARAPPDSGWTQGKHRRPHSCSQQGNWLFSRMELCGCGDLQEWVSSLPDALPDLEDAVSLVFQMCFAVYSGRAEFAMRHYDLKLLNFLAAPDEGNATRYALGTSVFQISKCPVRAKLADFGTAWLGATDLDREPTGALLTTLENAPIELLACGYSKSSFAADTFSLGLAALHLFTGDRPYEEIMHDVRCPHELCISLAGVWLRKTQFSPLALLARDLDPADPDLFVGPGGEKLDRTLFDTFYRYLVLLSPPLFLDNIIATRNAATNNENDSAQSVYRLARMVLVEPPRHATRSKRGDHQRTPGETYRDDRKRYSMSDGDHPSVARARARLDRLGPDAKKWLLSMVDFEPSRRPTMRSLLLSPLFSSLAAAAAAAAAESSSNVTERVDTYSRCSPSSSRIPLPDL